MTIKVAHFSVIQKMPYSIYILYSEKADKYYVGQTSDLQKRVHDHNHPIVNLKYTAKYIPWELRFSAYVSEERGDAIRVELFNKKQKSKLFLQKIILSRSDPSYFQKMVENILRRKNKKIRN